MFTKREFRLPDNPSLTGNLAQDVKILAEHSADTKRAFMEIIRALNLPDVLSISKAQIYVDQGLQFPATQVASSDVNNLDDYEEGVWTPTVTAITGTFTTVSATGKYTKVGNVWLLRIVINVTTNGTAATAVQATLPVTATETTALAGRESNVKGFALAADIASGASVVTIVNYDNTYPAANGYKLTVSGIMIG